MVLHLARPLSVAATFVVVGACGGAPKNQGAAPPKPAAVTPVEKYLPLENDTVFAYETESEGSSDRGFFVMHVTRPREGRADLTMGQKVRRLELVPEGIRLTEGGFLLKAPVAEGASWRGTDSTIRVVTLARQISVPAGSFTECLETEETSGGAGAGRRVTTVFCPGVGIVLLDVEGVIAGESMRETARLKSFGPRVDIGAPSK